MVSRKLARAAVFGLVLAVAGLLQPARVVATPTFDPGPFWPLLVGHHGHAYADALPGSARYQLNAGRLPQGLTLTATGAVTGTPTETGTFAFTLGAREASGASYPVRAALTVRRPDEADVPFATPSFRGIGAFPTEQTDFRVRLRSGFDNARTSTEVRLTRPLGAGSVPLLMLHRGRGFDHVDYDTLSELLASHGIAVASVEDRRSFRGRSFEADVQLYDRVHYRTRPMGPLLSGRAELGMQSANGVTEAVMDLLVSRSQDPQDTLYGSFRAEDVFFAGHSRGGGAAHGGHQRSFLNRYKGLIYLMAFDLRNLQACRPPGSRPAYPILDASPRTPSLILVAENDGDLAYPFADQLIDRATGPATQVTIYGAVHNLVTDSAPSEGDDRITRRDQQEQVADWITCFVKRWAGPGDATLDRRLYLGGHMASPDAAVASWYPSSRTLLVENAQDSDPDRNLLGRNRVVDLRRRERSFYPVMNDMFSLKLRHTILTPSDRVSSWRMECDRPQNVSQHTRLTLRLTQDAAAGWGWAGVWVQLLDDQGGTARALLYEPGNSASLLPGPSSLSSHNRFLEVHVDLARLTPGSVTLDPSRLSAVDLIVHRLDRRDAGSVVVDAVRFE